VRPPANTEKPISPDAIPQPKSADKIAEPTTPRRKAGDDEIKNVIARIFQDDVTLEGASHASVYIGDFNGDGSEDIAIFVKPAEGKIADLNSEVANWSIQAPRKVKVSADVTAVVRQSTPTGIPEHVESTDELLAVVHGFGPNGWRDPNAKQAYLLKSVVGKDIKLISYKELPKPVSSKLAKQAGDVISEVLDANAGYLFWNGSQYAWYHPQEQ